MCYGLAYLVSELTTIGARKINSGQIVNNSVTQQDESNGGRVETNGCV